MPGLLLDRLLTISELAARYPHLWSYDSLQKAVWRGQLGDAVIRKGRRVLIDVERLSEIFEEHRESSSPPSSQPRRLDVAR